MSSGPKLVTFIPGWGDYQYLGQPKNYDVAVLAFVTPYRYYGGLCSGRCALSLSFYFNYEIEKDVVSTVAALRAANPSIKILASLGGYSFNHFGWNHMGNNPSYPNVASTSCGYVCYPPANVADIPMQYTNTEIPGPYNCTPLYTTMQPSDYCYGPSVANKAANVQAAGDSLLNMVALYGLDGIDLNIEDTAALMSNDPSYFLNFLYDLAFYLRSKNPALIMTQSPLNAYVVPHYSSDKCFNWYMGEYAHRYEALLNEMVRQNLVDMIMIQFYNSNPNAVEYGANVVQCYDDLVTRMANNQPQRLLYGLCSFSEYGSCPECGSTCSDSNRYISTLITPTVAKYGSQFGGVMFWNVNGDLSRGNGEYSFSTPILAVLP
jgi:hypothetical protein